jgi:acyl carrier protein
LSDLQQQLETRIKHVIVSSLELMDVAPESIETEAPLFGAGLGLDSIDALELAASLEKTFGFKFADAKVDMKATFHSVRSLALCIEKFAPNAFARGSASGGLS